MISIMSKVALAICWTKLFLKMASSIRERVSGSACNRTSSLFQILWIFSNILWDVKICTARSLIGMRGMAATVADVLKQAIPARTDAVKWISDCISWIL